MITDHVWLSNNDAFIDIYDDIKWFNLEDTKSLCAIADEIRKYHGYRPMFTGPEDEMDVDGWYDFMAGVSPDNHVKLSFVVCNTVSGDNDDVYDIEIDDDEERAVYKKLESELKSKLDTTFDKLREEWNK